MNLELVEPDSYIKTGVGVPTRLVRVGREPRLLRTPDFIIIAERAYIDERRYIRVKPRVFSHRGRLQKEMFSPQEGHESAENHCSYYRNRLINIEF